MRRRLTAIRLDKIAAVDEPCQQHATVAIIKRAPGVSKSSPGYRIAKATFQEALEGNMIAGAVNEAFFDSFDGLWERNDAFRTALTDELNAGGDGAVASADYVASVKALVDEAVAAARNAGSTAADTSAVDKALTTAAAEWLAKRSPKEPTMKITTKALLKAAVAAFNPETSPFGHVAIIQKAATDLGAEDELPATGPLAKAKPPESDAELRKRIAVLEMPADVRKHFDGLPEADQAAFLAKSAEDRAEIVRKANEGDPVLYTTKKGLEIRKSAGAVVLQLAKDADEAAGELAKVRGELTGTTLEKRARAYPHVAQTIAVDMLKSVDQVGADSEAGKALMASLASMNKQRGGLFKSVGSTDGDSGDGTGEGDPAALTEFNAAVDKAVTDSNGALGRAEAMTKVRTANPDLFKRAYPPVEIDEEESDVA